VVEECLRVKLVVFDDIGGGVRSLLARERVEDPSSRAI